MKSLWILALTFVGAFAGAVSPPTSNEHTIVCRLTDEPEGPGEAGTWLVEIEVRGLGKSDGPLSFHESGWGWPLDWNYLQVVASDPPVAEVAGSGGAITLEASEKRRARLVYRVQLTQRGGENHGKYGLVPSRGAGYALGYSLISFLRPHIGGKPVEGEVSFEVVPAERKGVVVTGWNGRTEGRQRATPDTPWGNSPIAFGEPRHHTAVEEDGLRFESFQFTGHDATAWVTDIVRRLVPAITADTGWPGRNPSRVFMSDAMGGGMGSDYGIHIHFPQDAAQGHEYDRFFVTTIAHELFHEWLGVRVHESRGSYVWFREGFTEYFSQWLTARAGLISRRDFAETLEGYDRFARSSTSMGHVAFADASVQWRDGDGPNELMAYRGAPVLALATDVALREEGHPGLMQLIRDLMAAESFVFEPGALHEWFRAHDMEEFWNTAIAGLEVPHATDSLLAAGFEPTDEEVDVAYLGIQTIEEKPIWHVVGVDPEGPAAKAGVREGDIINGYFPFNGTPTPLIELGTPYTFGLDQFTPGIEGSFLGIERSGEPLKIFVDPELRPWGVKTVWEATQKSEAFFSFEPRE